MRFIHQTLASVALIGVVLALDACTRGGGLGSPTAQIPQVIELANDPGSTFKVTLRNDLLQIDRDSVTRSILAMSSDGSMFVFVHPPPGLVGAKPGTTVLLAGLALRKISSIETNGDFALVRTDPATFTDAITDGTMAWDHTVTFGGPGAISASGFPHHVSSGTILGAWLERNAEPTLADAPVTVNHTRTANGWQYTTQTTVGNNQLIIDETLTRQESNGVQIKMHAKGTFSNFNTSADIEIQNGQIVKFTYVNKNITGTIDFEWTATKSAPGPGGLLKSERLVTLPPLVSIPLDLEGFPFTLDIDSAMLVEPAFTGSDEMTHAHFTVSFSGDQGFTVANGVTTQDGALKSNTTIDPDTTSLSPIAGSAFVGALSLPKFELKLGIAPESLQPNNGAFADQAKQLLAQSGYAPALTVPGALPPGGAYTQLILSSGSMNFGTMDSFVPCQQTTGELSLKVGNAAKLGVSSNDPNETYSLKTMHLINPAVQYCATHGLFAGGPGTPLPLSTATGSCDPSATGSAADFYGVPSGTKMQAFAPGGHGGFDVQALRDAQVFANLRDSIPLSELNSAKLHSTKQHTGLGISGTGQATLGNVVVFVQPWEKPWRENGSNEYKNMYGGVIGFLAHYYFTDTNGEKQWFTITVEYLHLITKDFLPINTGTGEHPLPIPAGTYIDNQNQPIAQGAYANNTSNCIGFGSLMRQGKTLSKDDLDTHPLIGYLGATEGPHVHIQTFFRLGDKTDYKESNNFDPCVLFREQC
jgi:hypothetical protein